MDKKELKNILVIFEELVEFKKAILDYYEACADYYKEDKVFWSSFIEEERYRIQDIKTMASLIAERPGKFEPGEPFKLDLTKIFLLYAKNAVRKVRNGELTKREALATGLNIELSASGPKFNEIIRTADLEYLGIARDVSSNIVIHRSRLNKKINDMDKLNPKTAGKTNENRLKPEPGHKKDGTDNKHLYPVIDIVVIHNQFRQYLELFRNILAENDLRSSVWENIEKVMRFNKYEIEEHLLFEETCIFNKLSENPMCFEYMPLLDELVKDHQMLRKIIADVEAVLFKSDLPLPKEKTERVRSLLIDFVDLVFLHFSKEEEKILPLLNTLKQ